MELSHISIWIRSTCTSIRTFSFPLNLAWAVCGCGIKHKYIPTDFAYFITNYALIMRSAKWESGIWDVSEYKWRNLAILFWEICNTQHAWHGESTGPRVACTASTLAPSQCFQSAKEYTETRKFRSTWESIEYLYVRYSSYPERGHIPAANIKCTAESYFGCQSIELGCREQMLLLLLLFLCNGGATFKLSCTETDGRYWNYLFRMRVYESACSL